MAVGPAMAHADATAAIQDGAHLAQAAIASGADLIGVGEMGIANTTAASAITAVLTRSDPAVVTGPGTGLDAARVQHKAEVIRRAIAVNRPAPHDALDVLAKVGGFEIAGLCGVILGAAAARVPVALDGFISGAAALVAVRMAPEARHVLFASHRSAEPGHAAVLAALGLTPYLELSMRLGEGTGAALFVHLARAAAQIYAGMATFKSAGVDGPTDQAP
jgi:nicotinate-nucleotide--dimethylbenzimidazole phosphoribosyltransferase